MTQTRLPPDGDDAATDPQRRTALQLLGAAGGLLAMTSSRGFAAGTLAASPTPARVAPFPLRDVRVLDGAFLRAQQRTERYLLSLNPDRLLHNFRVNAGLQPKAPVYGGWESQEPWVEIRCHGHTLGHYLSGCALMFASTANDEFTKRCDYIVEELRACQEAGTSGLVCAFPDGATQLINSVTDKPFLGVPWYTMHKIFAGLHDVFIHTGNRVAREVLTRLSDWALNLTQHLSEAQFQKMLDREHGGMSEILAEVHVLTGDAKYLQLAERFVHQALLKPLTEGRDPLDGLHSNTQIPKVLGFARLHALTGNESYRRAAEYFWKTVIETRTYAIGGNGDFEFFFPRGEFEKRLVSAKTMETCCFYNMMRLTRLLFAAAPTAAYADYYERALYNGILGSQDPDTGMVTYFQPTRPGYLKIYCTPVDSFWCCTGSGMESHAKYGDSIYFHDDDSLVVNLFMPSTLQWQQKGLTLTQTTRFPESAATQLNLRLMRPTRLRLKIRHPHWCRSVRILINGRQHEIFREPSRYIEVEREWRDGDVVAIELPMHLRVEPLPGVSQIVALLYGPMVLAGRYGTAGIAPGADLIINERTIGDELNLPMELPQWSLDVSNPARQIRRSANDQLTFMATGVAGKAQIELIPYQQIAHERYNLYWRIS